jgi:ribosomal protein S18 acetylase RimI-like enzyme
VSVVGDITVREARGEELHDLDVMAAEVAPAAAVTAVPDVVFVAEAEHHLAGFAAVRRSRQTLLVDRLVVAQTDEGRGVGNRLLDWIEGYGVSRRLARVRIAVERENRVARDFYRRRGYAPAADDAVERELVHQ